VTVTLGTPPGDLDERTEPIEFTSTQPVVAISVEFDLADGNGSRETVFDGTDDNGDGGTFSFPYRFSTHVDDAWSIVRDKGWPGPFQIAIKEGAPPVPPSAALQPTLYAPLVQWALQGAPSTAQLYNDRSGNGRHLTSGTATPVPDLIPGQSAVTAANLGAVISALALAGPMTLTARVKPSGSGLQILLDVGDSGPASNYLIARLTSGALAYSPVSGVGYDTGSIVMPNEEWSFISLRRASPTDVTLGIGAQYVNLTAMAPGAGTTGIVILGMVEGDAATRWLGAFADVCIWGRRLTDAELDVLRKVAMGEA
jgi:hypothetical protein